MRGHSVTVVDRSEAQTGQQADSVVFEASDGEVMDLERVRGTAEGRPNDIEPLGMRGIVAGSWLGSSPTSFRAAWNLAQCDPR